MTGEPTLEQVQAVVARVAGRHHTPVDAGPNTPLTQGGYWLDSVRLLETVIACEEEFGVVFDPATDFSDRTLITVSTLRDLIRAKRSG
jgi:acyl carrier protein